jgi:hypothetical protein
MGAWAAVVGQSLQASLAGSDHGDFRHGENAVKQDEKQK